jgi:hypothetical protein
MKNKLSKHAGSAWKEYENSIKFSDKTDALNFLAMKVWFLINPPRTATIQVESLENLTWLLLHLCSSKIQKYKWNK